MRRGTGSLPIFVWLYTWFRYLVGVIFSALNELSYAYQIVIQSHYQFMLKLDEVVTSVYDDRQNMLAPAGLSVVSIHEDIPKGDDGQPERRTARSPPTSPWEDE